MLSSHWRLAGRSAPILRHYENNFCNHSGTIEADGFSCRGDRNLVLRRPKQNMPVPTIDLLYVISGFSVGILVGLTGVGRGSLMTPLLILLFGVHPTTAVGTDLLFAASTKATGTVVHATARTIDWLLVGRLAMGSIPASIVTLLLLSWFDLKSAMAQHTITIALGALLLATAVFLLAGRRIREHYVEHLNVLDQRTRSFSTVVLGLVMGALVTLTSLGAGAIGVMVLLLLHPKMPASRVVGSDIAHAVPLMLLAGAGHWYIGSIDWGRLNPLFQGVREESRSGCSREQCRSRVRFFKSDDLSARSQQGGLYEFPRAEREKLIEGDSTEHAVKLHREGLLAAAEALGR